MNRSQADTLAHRALLRLVCAASMTRTALTELLPLVGTAAWWVTPLAMLPGVLLMLLARAALAKQKAPTLPEAIRAAFGRFGAGLCALLLGLLLMLEAAQSLQALMILFAEGIGTRGTRFTLALLTGGVMLFCLHRDGLPRGVFLLRWPMGVCAVLLAAFALSQAQIDHLIAPVARWAQVLPVSLRLAWPLLLLTLIPPLPRKRRSLAALSAAGIAAAVMLLLALQIPAEALPGEITMAHALMLPVHFLPTALRTLGHCLLMLTLFLSIAGSAMTAAKSFASPFGRMPGGLPLALTAALTFTQRIDPVWWNDAMRWSLSMALIPLSLLILAASLRRRIE